MFALVSPNKITRDTGEPFRKRLKQNAAALRFAADHSAQGKANEIIDILQKDVHFSPDVVAQHADDMLLLEVIEVGHDFRRELLCIRIQKQILFRVANSNGAVATKKIPTTLFLDPCRGSLWRLLLWLFPPGPPSLSSPGISACNMIG